MYIALRAREIIREFVRSLGIEELDTKIKRLQAQNPEMTEEDALKSQVLQNLEAGKAKVDQKEDTRA